MLTCFACLSGDDTDVLMAEVLQAMARVSNEKARRIAEEASRRAAAQAAEAEQKKLKKECPVCFDRVQNCSFQCGHVFCVQCASKVEQCPTCRVKVQTRTKLFM